MVSESPGRNESERTTGLETVYSRGRAFLHEAKAAWNAANWPTRRITLAGLERQHDDKDALSNWRNPTRPGEKSTEARKPYNWQHQEVGGKARGWRRGQ